MVGRRGFALGRTLRRALPMALALSAAACETAPQAAAPDAGESPNASILPAPLATESPDFFDAGGATDEGARLPPADTPSRWPQPESLVATAPPPPDSTPYAKDASGVSLEGAFRWRDVPPAPRAPEVSEGAHRDALRATALSLKVDLSDGGRMRAELTGGAFLLPAHTEIRARADHYGNIVVWPDGAGYRVIPPGAVRTTIGERRVDVMPLAPGAARAQGDGRRLGYAVRRVELGSSVATVRLELARVAESGEGGALLCRMLVELGGVDPRTPACQPGEVPLAASYTWQEGGGIAFEVSSVTKRSDIATTTLMVPPSSAAQIVAGLPAVPHGIFLSREILAALRTSPVAVPTSRDPQVPGEGFVAANASDRLMVLLLDGIPAVWVPPFGDQYVVGPIRGRYGVQWRSFLGEKVGPAQVVEVPARIVNGAPPDAGAPDGGSP